jgi:hypothetical protein
MYTSKRGSYAYTSNTLRNAELENRTEEEEKEEEGDYKEKILKFAVNTNWVILKLVNSGKLEKLSAD